MELFKSADYVLIGTSADVVSRDAQGINVADHLITHFAGIALGPQGLVT